LVNPEAQAIIHRLTQVGIVVIEFILLIYVLWHINTHETYKTGNRVLWNIIALVGMNFVGPILYLVIGKSDE
jgi:hypothetical protein